VAIDGALSAVIGAIVVFSSSFNTIVSNFLLFMNVWLAPWAAVSTPPSTPDLWRSCGPAGI
jgi:purine-cytosine permease-like protein